MRSVNIMTGVAAAAVFAATGVQAQSCPASAPVDLSIYGPEVARLGARTTAHRPAGFQILGQSVPYVVVERFQPFAGRMGAVERLHFRLGTVRRDSGESLPARLIAAFNQSQPQDPCEAGAYSCSSLARSAADGGLEEIEVSGGDFGISAGATGPGLAAVDADYVQGFAPAYLLCTYSNVY